MVCAGLVSLFGCFDKTKQEQSEKQELSFDTSKAYCYHRSGVIAGGDCKLIIEPQGIVTYYSYVKYPPENECGMRDKGADIYFVGLKEGRAEVTVTFKYPTCEDEVYIFTLNVDENLCVTKID